MTRALWLFAAELVRVSGLLFATAVVAAWGGGPRPAPVITVSAAAAAAGSLPSPGTCPPMGDRAPGATLESVPNAFPLADAGRDQTVLARERCTALAVLDGGGSSDPDGDELDYGWAWPGGCLRGVRAEVALPVGTHRLTLTAVDPRGATATATTMVSVLGHRACDPLRRGAPAPPLAPPPDVPPPQSPDP